MTNKILALLLVALFLLPTQSISLNIAEIKNLKDIEKAENITFSSRQIEALEKNGFFLVPIETPKPLDPNSASYTFNEMVTEYKRIGGKADEYARRPENTVFITSDFMLHLYHILIDRTFQAVEEEKFHPTLLALTAKLFDQALKDYKKDKSPIKRSLAAYFLVPLSLLEAGKLVKEPEAEDSPYDDYEAYLKFTPAQGSEEEDKTAVITALKGHKKETPAEVYKLAKEELQKIMKADSLGRSGILPGKLEKRIDYTQFKPRSHYTKNEILRSFFRAMIWYGRMGFELKDKDLTRMALYMVRDIHLTGVLADWRSIYDPTVFFVGKSDDLTIYDYTRIMKKVYGKISSKLEFPDDAKLTKFVTEAKKLKGPAILSQPVVFESMAKVPEKGELLASTKGFRFMGQRFIPDSYIFSTLTQGDEPPDPETGQKLPSIPTALMVMSVLGSDTADQLLGDWIKKEAPNSDRVIAKYKLKLIKEFDLLDKKTWTQNIYWSWLYTLKSLFRNYGPKYPAFMRNRAWQEKCLLTSLGSWTELRHDTLLYAKQSGAELGGEGYEELPPVPKGYVEPNQEFFSRLISLNYMTMRMLERFKLLEGQKSVKYKEKYSKFSKVLNFLKKIVGAEMSQETISDDDFERLRVLGYELRLVVMPVPYEDIVRKKDTWTGLIADVHTAYNKGQILYEAIGRPMKIYMVIKDKAGARMTRGLTYSYYEFTRPLAKRLTDEDWQAIIYEKKGTPPPRPEWTEDLIR